MQTGRKRSIFLDVAKRNPEKYGVCLDTGGLPLVSFAGLGGGGFPPSGPPVGFPKGAGAPVSRLARGRFSLNLIIVVNKQKNGRVMNGSANVLQPKINKIR